MRGDPYSAFERVDFPDFYYHYSKTDDRNIVIEATSEGLLPVRLTIPTSTNRNKDSVLSVATKEAGRPVSLFMG